MGTVNQATDEFMAGLNVLGQRVRVASPVPLASETSPYISGHIQVDCGGRHFESRRLRPRARQIRMPDYKSGGGAAPRRAAMMASPYSVAFPGPIPGTA